MSTAQFLNLQHALLYKAFGCGIKGTVLKFSTVFHRESIHKSCSVSEGRTTSGMVLPNSESVAITADFCLFVVNVANQV